MTVWRVALGSVLIGIATTGCSDDAEPAASTTSEADGTSSSSTSTAPERQASTTTTAYDPATVEGQVEAAYLRSWDVYADAVYDLKLDEAALAEVYAEPLLAARVSEISRRITEGRAALVRVEHGYRIDLTGPDTAAVVDNFTNHQVLVDPETKEPVEADPNEVLTDVFTLRLVNGAWLVFDHRRIER